MAGRVLDGSVQLRSRCGGAPLLDHEIKTPVPASHRGKIEKDENQRQCQKLKTYVGNQNTMAGGRAASRFGGG